MCPGARTAEQDFATLASQLGSSLYLEEFLASGFPTLPRSIQQTLPGLSCWRGVSTLNADFAGFVRQPLGLPQYCFGQSSSLIRFAAQCLFRNARRVLTTDLAWPAYVEQLKHWARKSSGDCSVVVVPLRDWLMNERVGSPHVVDYLVKEFRESSCDGLFISDISYLGWMLPVTSLLYRIRSQCRFSVVDGAQALGQRDVDLERIGCDLYLAGTQKWFRAYHPLRLAFCGRSAAAETMNHVAADQLTSSHSRDALFDFCHSLGSGSFHGYGETVNVSALLAAAGALQCVQREPQKLRERWLRSQRCATQLLDSFAQLRWKCHVATISLRSRLLLLSHPRLSGSPSAQIVRRTLLTNGVVASSFSDGLVRLSMPSRDLQPDQVDALRTSLAALVS